MNAQLQPRGRLQPQNSSLVPVHIGERLQKPHFWQTGRQGVQLKNHVLLSFISSVVLALWFYVWLHQQFSAWHPDFYGLLYGLHLVWRYLVSENSSRFCSSASKSTVCSNKLSLFLCRWRKRDRPFVLKTVALETYPQNPEVFFPSSFQPPCCKLAQTLPRHTGRKSLV